MAQDLDFGIDTMPFSLEAEQAVLGCVLIDPACMVDVVMHLVPDYFYIPQNKAIYTAMYLMYVEGKKIDAVLVLESLVKQGVYDEAGGKTYLAQLAQGVPSVANVEQYAKIIREKYYLRSLIHVSKATMDDAMAASEEADMILDAAEKRIYDIRQGRQTGGPKKLSEVIVNEVFTRLNDLNSENRDKYKGIDTGYKKLDSIISGLNKSDLILVGARPAMGKTSFALNLARNVGLFAKKKVVFFSLEMTKEQLAERLISTESGVPAFQLRTGMLSQEEWNRIGEAAHKLNDAEIYLDDQSSLSVPELKSRVRRMKDVDCVIIDYLGLLKSGEKKENRVQEVSEITRGLKMMAKELNIPVVVAAQLHRGTVDRTTKPKRPQLSDLRESGSIEQDADIVMFLYRESYMSTDDSEEYAGEDNGVTELIVAKNRHGATATVELYFDKQFTKFTTLEKVREDDDF